jgi:hypothetical protein
MNLIRKIAGLFSGGGGGGNGRNLPIFVLSRRCNEPLAGTVDLYNELSQDEEETGYYCRKVLHTGGESRCFDQVEVNLWFDSRKNLERYEVEGGRWLSEAEYEQELVRFNTPPDTDDDVVPTLAENKTAPSSTEETGEGADPQAGAANVTAADGDTDTTTPKT